MIENGITVVGGYLSSAIVPQVAAAFMFAAVLFTLRQDKLALPLAVVASAAIYFVTISIVGVGLSITTIALVAIMAVVSLLLWRIK